MSTSLRISGLWASSPQAGPGAHRLKHSSHNDKQKLIVTPSGSAHVFVMFVQGDTNVMKKLLLASTFALALPLAAFAQTSGSMSDPTMSSNPSPAANMKKAADLSATDRTFIKTAAIAGFAEVNDGQLAQQMGDDAVKQIGAKMVTDHTKANNQLAALSQQLGDPAPMQTDSKHMQMSAALKAKSGAAFDTAYLADQLTAHEKAIALFKKEINNGGNSQLKTFAQNTLPILEEHLSMIKSAQQS
jgi:putative membrane protein